MSIDSGPSNELRRSTDPAEYNSPENFQARQAADRAYIQGLEELTPELRERKLMARFEAMRQRAMSMSEREITDKLTGYTNKEGFNRALARLVEEKAPFGLLMGDLDNFKQVNDLLGHFDADVLLINLFERMGSVLRPEDTLSRWGGDESGILLRGVKHPEQVQEIGSRIVTEVGSSPIHYGKGSLQVNVTMGGGLWTPGTNPDDFVRQVDQSLDVAKKAGKNTALIR